jgi:hypothetical protein
MRRADAVATVWLWSLGSHYQFSGDERSTDRVFIIFGMVGFAVYL